MLRLAALELRPPTAIRPITPDTPFFSPFQCCASNGCRRCASCRMSATSQANNVGQSASAVPHGFAQWPMMYAGRKVASGTETVRPLMTQPSYRNSGHSLSHHHINQLLALDPSPLSHFTSYFLLSRRGTTVHRSWILLQSTAFSSLF